MSEKLTPVQKKLMRMARKLEKLGMEMRAVMDVSPYASIMVGRGPGFTMVMATREVADMLEAWAIEKSNEIEEAFRKLHADGEAEPDVELHRW